MFAPNPLILNRKISSTFFFSAFLHFRLIQVRRQQLQDDTADRLLLREDTKASQDPGGRCNPSIMSWLCLGGPPAGWTCLPQGHVWVADADTPRLAPLRLFQRSEGIHRNAKHPLEYLEMSNSRDTRLIPRYGLRRTRLILRCKSS